MSNIKVDDRSLLIELKYPECIVNEMLRRFSFRENFDRHIEVKSNDNIKRSWTAEKVVLETYIDFAKFVCDFVKYELPKEVQHLCWAYRIDEVIKEITDMVINFECSHDTYQFKPGIFVNGEPIEYFVDLKKVIKAKNEVIWA